MDACCVWECLLTYCVITCVLYLVWVTPGHRGALVRQPLDLSWWCCPQGRCCPVETEHGGMTEAELPFQIQLVSKETFPQQCLGL